MDILNWLYLAKNRFIRTTPSSQNDLLVLGAKVGFSKRGDKYQNYAMSINDLAAYVNESTAGNCPITMNFKPGSIGEKVSFRKESGSDPNTHKDVIIPGELEITRGNNNGGIYNIAQEGNFNGNVSPVNTSWSTEYVDTAYTTWAPLWDVQNRNFTNWRNAVEVPSSTGDYMPPMYVGIPAVMRFSGDGYEKYYLIMFTEWGVGGNGEYGFAYDRYEILDSVFFQKPSVGNPNAPFPADVISAGVQITRGNNGVIYNPLFENFWEISSPENTRWNSSYVDSRPGYSGFDDLNNLESRIYSSFYGALDGYDENIGSNVVDEPLIMHDLTTDLYYKVVFSNWAQGCGSGGQQQGQVLSYTVTNQGSGYTNGTWTICGDGGSGNNFCLNMNISGGVPTITGVAGNGYSYEIGDVVTFSLGNATDLLTVEITSVCQQGGFSYTRTVIPQSCGVKFADGTLMNTAVNANVDVTSGTYVPDITPATGTANSALGYYTKVGNVVNVTVYFQFLSAGSSKDFRISVPIPRINGNGFDFSEQALGTFMRYDGTPAAGITENKLQAFAGSDDVRLQYNGGDTSDAITCTFTYVTI